MRVSVIEDGRTVAYLKGAAEVLLERSTLDPTERQRIHDDVEAAAANGYRILGLAWSPDDSEEQLTWLGTVSLWDPPRPEVHDAIATAQAAGIRVLMITGDHPATASAIAADLGIPADRALTGPELDDLDPAELSNAVADVHVFARVSPEHKLALVEALKARGEIVAMTGDGVNDAPALKRADVGVAMGQRGSDVSREVADLVLLDDNFATIAAAVEEGRGIYDNIQKFLRFLFSTNVALVILVAVGVVGAAVTDLRNAAGDLLVPLTAAQLLWINVIADGPPALALGVDRNPGVMQRQPRAPSAPLLTRAGLRFIFVSGGIKASARTRPVLRAARARLHRHRSRHRRLPLRIARPAGIRLPGPADHRQAGHQPHPELDRRRHDHPAARHRQHPRPANRARTVATRPGSIRGSSPLRSPSRYSAPTTPHATQWYAD